MRKQTKLLIEDDAPSRDMLKSLLEDLNYQFLESQNECQALALAVGNQAYFVPTDFCLADIDGAELKCRLHKRNAVPIVIVTCSNRDDYYAATVTSQYTAFSKPKALKPIESTVVHLPRQHNLRRQNQQTNQRFSYLSDYAVPA